MTARVSDGVPQAPVAMRPTGAEDVAFIRSTWRESYHRAPQRRRMPWAAYKATYGLVIDQLLAREDVWTLGAYDEAGNVLGWIAWTPGRISVVHYVYVRHEARRAGLAMRLIDAAQLGPRLVYTFRGVKPNGGPSLDRVLADALGRRGVGVAHIQIREFLGGR